jgi:gamma-glutamylcyclotransferase (GGCT)/AIG2-like uncharacterized protein YtfP
MPRLYFGYGSNLDEADFLAYVGARGHGRAALRGGRPAFLPDHAPAYRYRSDAREGGALDVRPCPGAMVPGALFEVDEATVRALDDKEGVSSRHYERLDVCVLDHEGNEHRAFTYRVCEERLIDFMPPTEGYARVVARGLERHGLPNAWHERASRGEVLHPLPVFVYGTLRRGGAAEHQLHSRARFGVEEARARGRLLHLGEYPGLVSGVEWVRGEIHRYETLAEILPHLDEYEDFRGYGASENLYRRVVDEVVTEAGSEHAWLYRYLGDPHTHPEVEGGDWRAGSADGARTLGDLDAHRGLDRPGGKRGRA